MGSGQAGGCRPGDSLHGQYDDCPVDLYCFKAGHLSERVDVEPPSTEG